VVCIYSGTRAGVLTLFRPVYSNSSSIKPRSGCCGFGCCGQEVVAVDTDVSSIVLCVYFQAIENWNEAPVTSYQVCFEGGHGFFSLILAAILHARDDRIVFFYYPILSCF